MTATPTARPTPKTIEIEFGGQNVTSGRMSETAGKSLGIMVMQELDAKTFRPSMPDGWRLEVPDHDPRQGVCWDTALWQEVGEVESIKVHKSGKADPKIPDQIATPSRWVHRKRLQHRESGVIVSVVFCWWINSWKPAGPGDRWTAARARLARRARKATVRMLKRAYRAGDLVLCEGDFNSVVARLRFKAQHLRTVWGGGLDRLFVSAGKFVEVLSRGELPLVGTGLTMKHHGKAVRLRVDVASYARRRKALRKRYGSDD